MSEQAAARRMTALGAVIAFAFAAIVTRLWFLQVLAADEYRDAARGNYVRLVPEPAPRGRILDRNGEPLLTNRETRILTVRPEEVDDEEALLASLSELLGVPAEELSERLNDPDYLPYQPVPVYEGAPADVIFYIAEHPDDFPGVSYQKVGERQYVRGDLAPHVLGYLGQISPEELKDPAFADVRPGQLVGRGGVEQAYEEFLRGDDGWVKQEVDASGDLQAVLGVQDPTPGDDLVLSIDGDIQELAEDTIESAVEAARVSITDDEGQPVKATAGAVVVLDPNSGHVLAMASYPTYDPRVFLHGLTEREFARLKRPSANYPLANRAVSGLYPPGSTFKPFVATTAVKAGYASPDGYYTCPARFKVPGDRSGTVFHNWKTTDSGTISFAEALIQSCDTVFYDFGLDFYVDRKARGEYFQEQIRRWGFGQPTGIDIPGESEGRVPDARWKQDVHAESPDLFPEPTWLPGDNINMAIGQGDLLVTPLQMAAAYGALANGGTLYRPQIALRVQEQDGTLIRRFEGQPIGQVGVKQGVLTAVRNALTGVVSSASGTATTAFAGFPLSQYPVAAKTGTAEAAGRQPHSWFAAIAPANDPAFVVVSVVEEAGHGSEVAAPIVRRVLEGLLDLEPGAFNVGGVPTD